MKNKNHLSSQTRLFPAWIAFLLIAASGLATQAALSSEGIQSPHLLHQHRLPAFEKSYLNLYYVPFQTAKNPADLYCQQLGYTYRVISLPDGSQDSLCLLPGDNSCPAWDFLNGKCGNQYNACAKNGWQTQTLLDGKNPFSAENAVCFDPQGRRQGSVIELTGLVEKVDGELISNPLIQFVEPEPVFPASPSSTSDLPAAFDWRSYNGGNWTTPVKNQGICGSCWAFSAVGAAEAVTNIAANDPNLDLNLSEEYLVSNCSSAGSCSGGWHGSALAFIRDSGITDESCFPYQDGSSGGCTYTSSGCSDICTYKTGGECSDYQCESRCPDWVSRLAKIKSTASLSYSADVATVKQALVEHGPLSVAMRIAGGGSFNEDGIFTCPENNSLDHGVVIVGYNDEGSYWIVKNSWGTGYHDAGYFKVAYDNCAIQKFVSYAEGIMPGNPLPDITSLYPTAIAAGSSSFTLTVYGSDFVNGESVVRWNGTDQPTTYISSSELQATIQAADLTSPALAEVTVFTTNPGGGTSNAEIFTIFGPATLPFSDNFETGSTSSAWELITTGQGRVQIDSPQVGQTLQASQGSYSLLLDDNADDQVHSTAAAILHLDLSGHSSAHLSFWWREYDDENHSQDGVFTRGSPAQSWCQVMSFNNGPDRFAQASIDLAEAANSCGIAFSTDFQVMFQFYDNWSAPIDGYAIDDVYVVDQAPLLQIHGFVPFLIDTGLSSSGLVNGGFESGPDAGWLSSSALGQQLVQRYPSFPWQPYQGEWAAMLGDPITYLAGSASPSYDGETDSLSQQVYVPDSYLYLVVWYVISSLDECGSDQALITINGSQVAQFDLCSSNQTDGWQAFGTSLSSYAGQVIDLEFWVQTDSDGESHFLLDDINFSYPMSPEGE
jgi:putative hemolysin